MKTSSPLVLLVAGFSLLISVSFAAPVYQVSATFESAPGNALAGLVKLPDGIFYGVAPLGGEGGGGCVFKVQGTGTVVASFSSIGVTLSDSSAELSRLVVMGSAIYGIHNGGAGASVIWKWNANDGLSKLADIDAVMVGTGVLESFVVASDGTIYGACSDGPISDGGSFWKWTAAGGFELILEFDGVGAPYQLPVAGLSSAPDGTVYGLTDQAEIRDPDTGALTGYSPAKLWKWTEANGLTTLADVQLTGAQVTGNFSVSPTGAVFGVAVDRNATNYDTRVPKLWKWASPDSSATLVHSFAASANISAQIVFDAAGNAFGATELGGTGASGQVWRVAATGGAAVVQASLPATAGKYTSGNLFRDPGTGQVFGLSYFKGVAPTHEGAVWRWTPTPLAVSVEATLTGWGTAGGKPQGVLVDSATGFVYGVSVGNNGDTQLWRANGATITVLATLPFATYGTIGESVTLVKDGSGNIYGITSSGPAAGKGALWKWTAATSVVSKLAAMGTAAVPGNPTGTLIRDASGNFYGLSQVSSGVGYYGSTSYVVLWRASPTGVLTNLGVIDPKVIGHQVSNTLILDGSTIYGVCESTGDSESALGVTGGMVWKWTAAGGIQTALNEPGSLQFMPQTLMKHSNGSLYFVCPNYDDARMALWSWSMNPAEPPMLVSEDDVANVGANSYILATPLIEGLGGLIYGTFPSNGAGNAGVLWSLDPAAPVPAFTVLHSFSGVTGRFPSAQQLTFDARGSLFGVARDVVWRFGEAPPGGSALPVVSNVSTTGLAATTVTINATVNPSGADAQMWVELGTAAIYLPTRVATSPSTLVAADPATAITASVPGLLANTTYFYRVAAQNAHGVSYSPTQSFKTLVAIAPAVVTSPVVVTTISATGATLAGTVNPRGASVTVVCDYGLSATALNSTLTFPTTLTGTTAQPVSFPLTTLAPHTRYYFRIRASGSMGTTSGATLSFLTGNRAPTGFADTAVALPGAPVTIDVCGNDVDVDGDALTVFSFTAPLAAQGTVSKTGGKLIFNPAATFTGPVNITYIASDPLGQKSAATSVAITMGTCTPSQTVVNVSAGSAIDSIALPFIADAALPTTNFRITQAIDVVASAPFTVVESVPWLSGSVVVDPAVPISQAVLYIDPNPSVALRSGFIKIGGVSVEVRQAGVQAPALDTMNLDSQAKVGAPYRSVIGLTNAPATMSVIGTLPPGLKFYPSSGIVAGVPTKDGMYPVTFKAVNAALPAGVTTPFTFTVAQLPNGVAGSYAALVNREPNVNADLGGRVTCSITSAAALTGALTVDGAAHSFTGVINPDFDPGYTAGARIEVKRTGKPSYFLTLLIGGISNSISGRLELAGLAVPATAPLLGHRTPYSTSTPATDFAARYVSTVKIDTVFQSPSVPAGDGYLTMVAAANGSATLGGKLADGTAITGSAILGESPALPDHSQVFIHVPLYAGTGSYQAAIELSPGGDEPNGVLSSSTSWLKKPQAATTVRAYRSGFSVSTTVEGWEWKTPAVGTNVLGLTVEPDNAELTVSGGEVELADQFKTLNRTFAISATNVCSFGVATLNPTSIAIAIVPSTGQFTGSFKLTDVDGYVPTKSVVRTVPFEGVIVPGPMGNFGSGFFLLSKLQADADHPLLPANPASTTSQLSGLIQFGQPTAGGL
ncbi:MAG: cadherin-like domain-containing protein [Verrucomicrobiaceae bacterium]|nr:cadherin-like domain-containing protein [Verrucomicrobiaceae bacterium]